MSDPLIPVGPEGPTGIVRELTIYINSRSLQWSEPTISFEQVVEQWNRLDPDRHVLDGLPSITWEVESSGDSGILAATRSVDVVDGISFTIDPNYLA